MQQLCFIKYKKTVFNDLKKTHQKVIAKDVKIEKCTSEIFCFDYQM